MNRRRFSLNDSEANVLIAAVNLGSMYDKLMQNGKRRVNQKPSG
jgi:hypothetical protein